MWNTDIGFDTEQTDEYPVVNVSWNDAAAFCQWLSKKEGVNYRLPAEAEWEFICRAGSLARFSFGNDDSLLESHAWCYLAGNVGRNTNPVGQKKANAFGLFDLHGNVMELCHDWYGSYTRAPAVDPLGPSQGSDRVIRGGAFDIRPMNVRSTYRLTFPQTQCNASSGFRIVRTYEKLQIAAETRLRVAP